MPMTTKPPQQNPALADFWEHRYRNNVTPWDAGRVQAALRDFATTHTGQPRVLIPGCGAAYEARYLAELDWQVTALDFSAVAIEAARATLGSHGDCLLQADFFNFEITAPFDIIYERAFFCSMPRRLWPDYATRMAQLLRPGGLLAGFFFLSDELKGPPFGTGSEELRTLLEPFFERIADEPVTDSIPVFQGKERWQVWQLKP